MSRCRMHAVVFGELSLFAAVKLQQHYWYIQHIRSYISRSTRCACAFFCTVQQYVLLVRTGSTTYIRVALCTRTSLRTIILGCRGKIFDIEQEGFESTANKHHQPILLL